MKEIKVCSLASGSNGNAYYIEADDKAILVDVGVSFKKLKNRAMTRRIDLRKLIAVVVSHEHSDHVYGLAGLCKHMGINAYMSQGTYNGMRPKYHPENQNVRIFKIGEPINIGPFVVHSFAKPHDVVDPCSFRIEANGISVGVFTDIGAACDGLEENLALCHLAFLESNYDEPLLRAGKYPDQLKRRIVGGFGHLSNVQSAQIVQKVNSQSLHTLFLSHVSEDNNRPDIVLQAFEALRDKYLIKVMSRNEASDIWRVDEVHSVCEPLMPIIPERLDRVPVLPHFDML